MTLRALSVWPCDSAVQRLIASGAAANMTDDEGRFVPDDNGRPRQTMLAKS